MAGSDSVKGAKRPGAPGEPAALATIVLAVALIAAAVWIYAAALPSGADPVKLQWSTVWTGQQLAGIRQHLTSFRTAVYCDLPALCLGLAGLLLACRLGRRVFWMPRSRAWASVGLAASVVAVVAHLAQDGLLLIALHEGLPGGALLDWAEVLSFVKFTFVLVAAAIGAAALVVSAVRLATSKHTTARWTRVAETAGDAGGQLVIPPPVIECAAGGGGAAPGRRVEGLDWWQPLSHGPQARWAQGFASPAARTADSTGICVSGGGIRSASVALGALQALRAQGVLADADYLVSVSGGGYTTGGLQLAVTHATPGGNPDATPAPQAVLQEAAVVVEEAAVALGQAEVVVAEAEVVVAEAEVETQAVPGGTKATPSDAFAPGSPEEDHLRRHSSYIAASLGQWLVALGGLLRGVLSSLVVIGLALTTAGVAIGEFYTLIPVAVRGDLARLRPRFAVTGLKPLAPAYPGIPFGVVYAIVVVGGLAVLAYLVRQLRVPAWFARGASRAAAALLGATLLLAALGVALPAALWASGWLTWPLGLDPLRAASVSSLSLVVTYLGAVVATFWRNRTTITKTASTVTGLAGKAPVNQVLPNSMIQLVLLWICMAFLIVVGLLACGWAATSELVNSAWALLPAGLLAVLAFIVDQTSMSMHPFYRRVLARAFAVRRVERDGVDVAEPYPDDEMTALASYGRPVAGFPAVTFAATANLSGQDRTPPGRSGVPFTFSSDYVGGPATGWVRTDFLQQLTDGQPVNRDLTVQAAMAISGAAFASAMGSATRFYEVFLAIANARLGAWLPNPFFVALKLANSGDWTIPGLPSRRRLSYFGREIFGLYPSTGRMLLCTDGGHYENLGLVELLRRRCKTIYCIDASGASQPLADALAGAVTLAREELGVEIALSGDALELISGGWDQLKPSASLTDLNSRLAKAQVIFSKITYPAVRCRPRDNGGQDHHEQATGTLVFAQAKLSPDVPYQLLDFPQTDSGFPHDSTGDQFFDASQFDSYQTLGHFIGQLAAPSRPRPPIPAPSRRQPPTATKYRPGPA